MDKDSLREESDEKNFDRKISTRQKNIFAKNKINTFISYFIYQKIAL
jgi:hypothetical protein